MRYVVQSGGEAYGGARVAAATADEALQVAQDWLDRGVVGVRVVDAAGQDVDLPILGRELRGHSLSPDQLDLIAGTCDVLLSADSQAADVFYDRLFEIAPEVRSLFPADLTRQKRKLLDTLGTLIGQVTHPDLLRASLAELGRRHAAYGARREHYGPVGQALLASLETLLGERFTPEVQEAWTALYADIAAGMLPRAKIET